ncbi:type VI secretion system-associated protein TagF [Pseudomonas tolaasii]|uniref:Type VI secretion system-associated protein TagF n=2 Tax=Pseudomonas tolaasii TaxID=29442 RepID=A0A7Y8ALC3_PSETO|nr:type VI secretion system-associated protein TagF [Pseudomonas tolaasii]ARB30428.1 type VI secretion-associated protein [Pseudomonas tolaasii]KAB0478428.1 type VI secretion system-associated protein TagF [Pseudomonas tolaasii]MBW1249331.1 type VI secretion system-associated protein TagF [Pseudomonas tolaasii]MBY8942537.1 type VI secretion system-associated protein TagF [Pseudomonas tolaasii]NVZ45013.1 type VI secretion system-associated protein TagF [Pseudomonas tolaasii]
MNGFFGKVASLGDFVSRRLPSTFLNPWDACLQAGLQCSRERLGEQWLEVYLCSPIWHFALAAGVCGDSGWAGVMIPSVDRVGRYFPLTLATAGEDVPLLARLERDVLWYGQLERLALSALSEVFSLDAFDEALLALPSPGCWTPASYTHDVSTPARWLDLPDPERIGDGMPQLSAQIDALGLAGHSLFWTEGSPRVAPSIWVGEGLPDGETFADMIGGL